MKRTIILLTVLALIGLSQSVTAQTDTLVSMTSNADTITIGVTWSPSTAVVKANGVVLPNADYASNSIPVNESGMVFITTEDKAQLTILSCSNNQLTALDVTNNPVLIALLCSYNQLTTLNVTNNTALEHLFCSDNQLTALDVTNNTALIFLSCFDNQLTELVTNNPVLTELYCYNNQLTALDVTNNPVLEQLGCANNYLTALDVTNNPALKQLHCFNNQLTALDVTNNPALTDLHCFNNQLTALDVTNNTVLRALQCNNNQLTELDIIHNTGWMLLRADGQQIEVPILAGATTFSNPILYTTVEGEQMIEIETVEYAYQTEVLITGDTMRFTTNPIAGMDEYAFSGTITFVTETSIAETQPIIINIYPNPAQHTLYIQSEEAVEQVSIYDISGRMLLQETGTSQSIDLNNLTNGIYLVKVKIAGGETVKKIVIN